jgi:hypothetical protein
MQRRDFLRQAGAAAAAASTMANGPFIHASDKSGSQTPVIGKGEHQYECHHGWGTLPDSIKWETTHGVTVDAEGLIYIKHQGNAQTPVDTIVVFDPEGKYVRSFGKGIYPGGHGIDLRVEGGTQYLYLCDVAHRKVLKSDLKGEVVWTKGYPEESGVYKGEEGFRPTNVAFSPDGGFYVADGYGSNYIHQYDKAAKWVRTWGGTGDAPGQFKTPHGLWLDDRPGREPSLVVADRANARLQYFTLDGKPLSVVSEVLFPAHFDTKGDVLLVPDLHARVSLFGKDNKVIVHLGDDPAWLEEVKKFKIRGDASAWLPGKFVHPHDACFDKDGNIFVTEWVTTGRVSKLRKVS